MAVTLQASTNIEISGTLSNQIDLEKYSSSFSLGGEQRSYTSSQVSKEFSDRRTLAASESLDLTALTNVGINTAQNYGSVSIIFIENKAEAQTLTVGGGTTPILANAIVIPAGGRIFLEGSRTVDGSHKLLNLTASGSLTYDILLIGN